MYIFGGYAVYFATRIMYDFEWDRYYHVNYPAIMEYFDVITNYYIKKVRKIHQNLPDTLEVYIPEYNLTPTFIRTKDLSKIENKKLGA